MPNWPIEFNSLSERFTVGYQCLYKPKGHRYLFMGLSMLQKVSWTDNSAPTHIDIKGKYRNITFSLHPHHMRISSWGPIHYRDNDSTVQLDFNDPAKYWIYWCETGQGLTTEQAKYKLFLQDDVKRMHDYPRQYGGHVTLPIDIAKIFARASEQTQ